MAPPNSSSFSVRVVLPASGCEMIAKVRRRAISAARSVMVGSSREEALEPWPSHPKRQAQHGGVLATADGLVIPPPNSDLLEAQRLVQAYRGGVGGTDFEIGLAHAEA